MVLVECQLQLLELGITPQLNRLVDNNRIPRVDGERKKVVGKEEEVARAVIAVVAARGNPHHLVAVVVVVVEMNQNPKALRLGAHFSKNLRLRKIVIGRCTRSKVCRAGAVLNYALFQLIHLTFFVIFSIDRSCCRILPRPEWIQIYSTKA